jgi:hypothetical protein
MTIATRRYPKAEGVQAEGQRSQTPDSPDPQFNIPNGPHQSRFSRKSRPPRLSQSSAIAAEVLMNKRAKAARMPPNPLAEFAVREIHRLEDS